MNYPTRIIAYLVFIIFGSYNLLIAQVQDTSTSVKHNISASISNFNYLNGYPSVINVANPINAFGIGYNLGLKNGDFIGVNLYVLGSKATVSSENQSTVSHHRTYQKIFATYKKSYELSEDLELLLGLGPAFRRGEILEIINADLYSYGFIYKLSDFGGVAEVILNYQCFEKIGAFVRLGYTNYFVLKDQEKTIPDYHSSKIETTELVTTIGLVYSF